MRYQNGIKEYNGYILDDNNTSPMPSITITSKGVNENSTFTIYQISFDYDIFNEANPYVPLKKTIVLNIKYERRPSSRNYVNGSTEIEGNVSTWEELVKDLDKSKDIPVYREKEN